MKLVYLHIGPLHPIRKHLQNEKLMLTEGKNVTK